MLAIEGDSVVVIDCGGDVVQRLLAAEIELRRIRLLVLTHEHPDHVAGFPLLMEKLWLSGRREPIPIRGPKRAIDQARRIFEAFDTSGWKGMPRMDRREVPLTEGAAVWTDDEWTITASPGSHSVPVIGLRIADTNGTRSVTYSADTEPAPPIIRLARGTDMLIHEATGDFRGHTSAAGAAGVAREAGVGRLVLVHLPANLRPEDLEAARAAFPDTELGRDGASYEL